MLDLDNTSVCKECAMMCTELQYEDADKDVVVYGDQEINTEEYEKAMYGNLTKTQSKEEEEVKYNVAQSTNDSVVLERKRRCSYIQKCHSNQSRPCGIKKSLFLHTFNHE